MATYNGEQFIAEQLNSILNQTYPNIEIIITDDNSADNTVGIIKEFQKINFPIRPPNTIGFCIMARFDKKQDCILSIN